MQIGQDDDLVIFEGNLKDAKELFKGITFIQDTLLEPLKVDMDMIKFAFNIPLDKLKDSIGKANTKSLEYKENKAIQLRKEKEEKEKAIQEAYEKEKAILLRIESLQKRMNAYLFGGTFPDSNGEIQSSHGCNSIKDCDTLLIIMDEKFPSSESYDKFAPEIDKIKVNTINNIYELKNIFEMINSLNDKIKEEGIKKMNKLRADNQVETEYMIHRIEKRVESESLKKFKELDLEIKSAKKNVRKSVKWEVTDRYRIPINYMNVEKRLVDNYQAAHLDEIKANIDSGKEQQSPMMPGIMFYYHESNISR